RRDAPVLRRITQSSRLVSSVLTGQRKEVIGQSLTERVAPLNQEPGRQTASQFELRPLIRAASAVDDCDCCVDATAADCLRENDEEISRETCGHSVVLERRVCSKSVGSRSSLTLGQLKSNRRVREVRRRGRTERRQEGRKCDLSG